ncbi:MAG: HAD family phosphatase [Halioglobus sp.]|nr:HAD family phosphatase [Halioglobus sp.]
MHYKFILFDNDGVLVDTEFWYFEATRRALADIGVALDQDTYRHIMVRGAAAWELAEQAGIDPALVARQKAQRNRWYQQYLRNEAIEIPGAADCLHSLYAQGYRMAIVTTAKRVDFDVIHRRRELLDHVEFVLTREDYERSKPDPEPYALALERFGAGPGEALVVEDSERGLRSALAAGIDCAVIHNEFTARHNFDGAICRLPSLAQLAEFLSRDN